jgi:hypothetical protein
MHDVLLTEDRKLQQILQTWFRWRGRDTDRKMKTNVKVVLDAPKNRPLRDMEVYSKLFYETKLKSVVEEEIKDFGLSATERFSKVLKVTKQEWEKETDEVKAEVQAKKLELQKERNGLQPLTSKQRQAAIDDMNHVVSAFLLHIKRTTGWTGFGWAEAQCGSGFYCRVVTL